MIDTTAIGFAKSHTNFGVLLSIHRWVMTVGGLWVQIFDDLDVGAFIF